VPKVLREGDASNFGTFTESADTEVWPQPHPDAAADSFFRSWLQSGSSGATPAAREAGKQSWW
jgi:hypothetical protein